MKTSLWLSLLLLSASAASAAVNGGIEFNGMIVADGKAQFSLTDINTGAFGWVPIGGNFSGYNITSYDEKLDRLSLKRGTLQLNVPLKNAVILEKATPAPNQPGVGGPNGQPGQSVAANLRQINAAAQQYFLETGQTSASMADLAKYLPAGSITPVNGENYSTLTINQGQPISISTPNGGTTTYMGNRQQTVDTSGTATATNVVVRQNGPATLTTTGNGQTQMQTGTVNFSGSTATGATGTATLRANRANNANNGGGG